MHINQEGIEQGMGPFTHGSSVHTGIMKTQALKQALDGYQFDAVFGGARRDEEKSRAKECVYSFRGRNHRWDSKNQHPELQDTRNMAMGASSCDVAVILIDARKGIQIQAHRHSYIVSLLGIKNVIVAVNKMDLVDFSEDTFNQICSEY